MGGNAAAGTLSGPLGAVLALPTTQLQLVRSILGAQQATSGDASAHHEGLSLSAAALGTATYTNFAPDRHNWLLAAPLRASSTLYDPALTVTLAIDAPTNAVVLEFPLADKAESVIAEFGIIRRQLFLTVINGTTSPAVVTFSVQYASVLETVVDQVWVPTLTADFALLKARAAALRKVD